MGAAGGVLEIKLNSEDSIPLVLKCLNTIYPMGFEGASTHDSCRSTWLRTNKNPRSLYVDYGDDVGVYSQGGDSWSLCGILNLYSRTTRTAKAELVGDSLLWGYTLEELYEELSTRPSWVWGKFTPHKPLTDFESWFLELYPIYGRGMEDPMRTTTLRDWYDTLWTHIVSVSLHETWT